MPRRKRVPNPHDAFFRRVFSDPMVAAEFLRHYLPDFEYHLCDLSKFDDDELQGGEGLGAVLKLLKHVFRRDLEVTLPEVILETATTLPETKAAERLETMATYLSGAGKISEETFEEALFKTSNEGGLMETFWKDWDVD